MKKVYYIEYSVSQKCWHIDTMDNIQRFNRSLCLRGMSNGYVIVAGPFTWNEAVNHHERLDK